MSKNPQYRILISSFALASVILISGDVIKADISNLKNDWVGAVNPNGDWRFKKNAADLFTIWQQDYYQNGANQGAWADDPFNLLQHVPVWFKSLDDGLVYTHGAELDRTGSDYTATVWTSTVNGPIRIDGQVWTVNNFGREMNWQVLINGKMITQGDITSDGSHSFANPFRFSDGSGGPFILSQQISVGDEIELGFTSISLNGNLGESLGVEFSMSLPGDVNGDGTIDLLDVTPFVDVLTSGSYFAAADINGDGVVDLLDVTPFIDLLTG